ncbi:hypothetical protein E3N88_29710 [Mikania micrantha]|uniref:Uncharacterized protein n=1 Tax=Mikania micrantha TaxID=192012 RepID=A0A5N6MLR4_9ASTR|nr:hypothetical protein E3N88_29710 [Mikania micrantha]
MASNGFQERVAGGLGKKKSCTAERAKILSAYRDGFRDSKSPAHPSRTVMGISKVPSVPRRSLEEPNRPNFNGLIRSSPFSRLRTIIRPCLDFQVKCSGAS